MKIVLFAIWFLFCFIFGFAFVFFRIFWFHFSAYVLCLVFWFLFFFFCFSAFAFCILVKHFTIVMHNLSWLSFCFSFSLSFLLFSCVFCVCFHRICFAAHGHIFFFRKSASIAMATGAAGTPSRTRNAQRTMYVPI